jgi:cation transport regulator
MPYATNAALPASVRSHLPEHAQHICRAAFNHAFDAHASDPRQEEAAHRIAWAAVKGEYVKAGDAWGHGRSFPSASGRRTWKGARQVASCLYV